MRSAFARAAGMRPPDPPQVWTLEPNAVYGTRIDTDNVNVEGLDADGVVALRAIVAVFGTLAAIMDSDPVERTDPQGWAHHWAQLAQHVGDTKKPARLTELAVHGAIIADARNELAQATATVGIGTERFSDWLSNHSRKDLSIMPAIGLAREVTYLKIANNTARWKPNDLTDFFYLVQAAGYADAVVGERGFTALIQQAQRRLDRPANAYPSLAALRASGTLDNLTQQPPIPA